MKNALRLCCALIFAQTLPAQTLADFGYGSMKVNGKPPSGQRPLLVILAQFAGLPAFSGNRAAYYDSLLFTLQPMQTTVCMNNFFAENSNARFSWRKAAIAGPVPFTASETAGNYANGFSNPAYMGNIVAKAVALSQLNLAPFDVNNDHVLTTDELTILIISNGDNALGNRPEGAVALAGSSYSISSGNANYGVIMVRDNGTYEDFVTILHESGHSLGAIDLYNSANLSFQLTLMNNLGGGGPTGTSVWHLDPWHKLALGWVEPRIVSMRSGGVFTLPAAQSMQATAPVILWDPAHGNREYFMIEYRTPNTSLGGGYDAQVAGSGMILWRVQLDANNRPLVVNGVTGGKDNAVWSEGPPAFARGTNSAWTSASPSPRLHWADGSTTQTRFVVRPFQSGDGSITVDVHAEYDTWVDFSYSGPQLGTFDWPFRTLAGGRDAASYGGTLNLKTGSTSDPALVSKALTLRAFNGPVTIGR
jgi:M6 family metalloprotease-like protein